MRKNEEDPNKNENKATVKREREVEGRNISSLRKTRIYIMFFNSFVRLAAATSRVLG